jgi:predicted small secreted protein
MKRKLSALILILCAITLTGCATAAGTAIGGGIGSISGNTEAGAVIGGGVGLLYDVF